MDKATIIGLVVGVVLLFWGMTDAAANNMKIYYSFSSILIVGGGTLAATLISFHLDQVMKAFQLFMIALRSRLPHPSEITTTLVGLDVYKRQELTDGTVGKVEGVTVKEEQVVLEVGEREYNISEVVKVGES